MLTQLFIRNIAIIEHLELEFHRGLTCITGETGAGKSVAIDALNLCLGGRGGPDVIHNAHEQGEVIAHFDISSLPKAAAWLHEHHLYTDDECWIRRVFTKQGRTRNYINGTPMPLHSLRELAHKLAHMHGQHSQQLVLKSEYQRQLLDEYLGHTDLCAEVKNDYEKVQQAQAELAAFIAEQSAYEAARELLTYQVNELLELGLQEQEYTVLERQHRRQAHTTDLIQGYTCILNTLENDEQHNVLRGLSHIEQYLRDIQRFDSELQSNADLLSQALIHLQEIGHDVQTRLNNLEFDPQAFAQTEQRLCDILAASKKHCVAPEALFAYIETKRQALENYGQSEEKQAYLYEQVQVAQQNYLIRAQALSKSRTEGARLFTQDITEKLRALDMPDLCFDIECQADEQRLQSTGIDCITFRMSANKGHALQDLSKVASGGELSRLALVTQLAIAAQYVVPTLVFDEADTGISGVTAMRVGEMLRSTAENSQIITITHLPQVAAQGNQHWFVSKQRNAQNTATVFTTLSPDDRVQELARLLAGNKITKNTLANARELLTLQ